MKLKTEILENTWLPRNYGLNFGWGNGYVFLPPGHPYHGVRYDSIPVEVHGGLTFSEAEGEFWKVGFDTAHWNDSLEAWPEERVQAETDFLASQLEVIEA